MHPVHHAGRGRHQIKAVFPLQALLDNLQMQKPQKTAAESKAQSCGRLRLVKEGGVVELKLLQSVPQVIVLGPVRRIQAAVHHGRHLFIARKGRVAGIRPICDRIAHPGIPHILDAGGQISHHARGQLLAGNKLARSEISHLHHIGLRPGGHHADGRSLFHSSVHQAAEHNHALVGVVDRIKNQGL